MRGAVSLVLPLNWIDYPSEYSLLFYSAESYKSNEVSPRPTIPIFWADSVAVAVVVDVVIVAVIIIIIDYSLKGTISCMNVCMCICIGLVFI